MKQLYPTLLAFVACMSQTSFADAETTINYPEAEQSTIFCDYWTNFSKETYTLESGEDKALHFQFYNYSLGVQNYHNWALCGIGDETNAKSHSGSQLFILRCDNWENIGGVDNQGTKTSDFNWDTFKKDMDGSFVDMTVKYESSTGTFTMTSTIKTADELKTYNYSWTKTITDSKPEKLYLYFACENSYICKDKAAEWKATKTYYPESTNKVTTGGYWTNPSTADYAIESGQKLNFQFYNYSSKANIWNNWLLCGIKDQSQKAEGANCEFILRTDNFDIKAADGHKADHCTENYTRKVNSTELADDVLTNLDGALVNMDVMYYESGRLGVKATFTKGTVSYDHSFYKDFTEKPKLYLFFQGDGSYIDIPQEKSTISEAMVYATYSSKFSVDFTDSNAKAYIITSSNGTTLTFKEVTKVPANTGVLLVATQNAELTIKATNDKTDDVTGNLLVADDGTKTAPANSYILSIKDNSQPGFYKSKTSRTLAKGKAHLELPATSNTTSNLCEYFPLDELGVLTGIEGVQATVGAGNAAAADYYNTAGQKVGTSYKGIVIRDGKKMILK